MFTAIPLKPLSYFLKSINHLKFVMEILMYFYIYFKQLLIPSMHFVIIPFNQTTVVSARNQQRCETYRNNENSDLACPRDERECSSSN